MMIGLADQIEVTSFEDRERRSEWAPYRVGSQQEEVRVRSRSLGFVVLASFLLFSGITVAVARANTSLSESYGISQASIMVAGWLIQGAAALSCFALAVRWLRS